MQKAVKTQQLFSPAAEDRQMLTQPRRQQLAAVAQAFRLYRSCLGLMQRVLLLLVVVVVVVVRCCWSWIMFPSTHLMGVWHWYRTSPLR